MTKLSFIPEKLLIGAGVLLSMSGCALNQHKHKLFLSIQKASSSKNKPFLHDRSDQSAGIGGQRGGKTPSMA